MPSLSTPSKTLVLLFDGTGNFFKQEKTNVIRLFAALENDQPDTQLLYYQPGVGTDFALIVSPPLFSIHFWLPLRHIRLPDNLMVRHVPLNSQISGQSLGLVSITLSPLPT